MNFAQRIFFILYINQDLLEKIRKCKKSYKKNYMSYKTNSE